MKDQQLSRFKLAILLFGIFVASFGVLSFEVSLTGIFSVILDYHYTFLVVSLALFGIGLGGIVAHYSSRKVTLKDSFGRLAVLAGFSNLAFTGINDLRNRISILIYRIWQYYGWRIWLIMT